MQRESEDKVNGNNKFTHDAFIKKAMARIEVATEFFEANLPEYILSRADLTTLKAEETDFLDNVLGNKTVDMLFSVKIDKQLSYINLLLEHQSTPDKHMPLRLATYMLQIWSNYLKKHKKLPLPIIHPMILYTGRKKYTAPRSFWDLFDDPELANRCFAGEVKVLELKEIDSIDLTNRIYSGAVLYFMKMIHQENILSHLEKILPILREICQKNFKLVEDMLYYTVENTDREELGSVLDFFEQTDINNDRGDMISIADALREQGMEVGLKRGREEGREEGMLQGWKNGTMTVAKNLLLKGVDVRIISDSTGLKVNDILKLKQHHFS